MQDSEMDDRTVAPNAFAFAQTIGQMEFNELKKTQSCFNNPKPKQSE